MFSLFIFDNSTGLEHSTHYDHPMYNPRIILIWSPSVAMNSLVEMFKMVKQIKV